MQVSLGHWTPKDHLNIDEVLLGPGLADGQVRGLLGVADRDPANDLTPSTGGSPVSPDIDPALPPYTQPLYRDFGQSWLVTHVTRRVRDAVRLPRSTAPGLGQLREQRSSRPSGRV